MQSNVDKRQIAYIYDETLSRSGHQ